MLVTTTVSLRGYFVSVFIRNEEANNTRKGHAVIICLKMTDEMSSRSELSVNASQRDAPFR